MTISLLAAAYLFFGGTGAGTFFFAACAGFMGRGSAGARAALVSKRGYAAALVLLVAGVVCLIFDLGRPEQALLVFLSPTWSYLTVGAYLLAALLLITLGLLLARVLSPRGGTSTAARVAKAVGMVVALGVMVYTGLLLRDLRPIPLWDSPVLPVLFLVSSLAAGLACVTVCAGLPDETDAFRRRLERSLARVDLVLVLAEALAAAIFVLFLALGIGGGPVGPAGESAAAASLEALTTRSVGALFLVGFGLCGLVVPAFADVRALRQGAGAQTSTVAAALAVAGCFCLRASLVLAGIHVGA